MVKNIIIIDDENEILIMLKRHLEQSSKYNVTTYKNPLIAFDEIRNTNTKSDIDLILIDIMMPQMNGLELLKKILNHNPKQKTIMMTAYSTLDKSSSSNDFGACEYIMKPFDSLELLEEKIEEAINYNDKGTNKCQII